MCNQSKNKIKLKVDDTVMVIAGGSKGKRDNKGQVGKIVRFVGADKDRAIVAGVNKIIRNVKQRSVGQESGRILREAPIHVSNLMYYVESLKRPVRLKVRYETIESKSVAGKQIRKKIRGYIHPETKMFERV